MTVAAIDRLVHHASIFEMNVESYRRRAAHAAATPISDIAGGNSGDTEKPEDRETTTPTNDIGT